MTSSGTSIKDIFLININHVLTFTLFPPSPIIDSLTANVSREKPFLIYLLKKKKFYVETNRKRKKKQQKGVARIYGDRKKNS